MPQIVAAPPATKQMLKTAEHINCKVPLSCVQKCQYKYCPKNTHNEVEQPQNLDLEKQDKFWSDFLKAQQKTNINFFYKINNTYGTTQDPTLVKKEGVPVSEINRRILHMPFLAGLLKDELFYLLSFMLNLATLPLEKQKEFMQFFLKEKLLNITLISYFQMVARHPHAGLTETQLKTFTQVLQHIMDIDLATNYMTFYNPDHIFMKELNDINPYELEYLNALMHSARKLTTEQTIYLTKFVHRLQEMDETTRESYMQFLRENQIVPYQRFEYLLVYLFSRAKRIDVVKLKYLLKELERLMDINPCEVEIPVPKPAPIYTDIVIDHARIDYIFLRLMHSVIPNIVLYTEFQKFLNNLMTMSETQIMDAFNNLKASRVMNPRRFTYIIDFINAGKLGKVDKPKKKFIELLKKISVAPIIPQVPHEVLVLPTPKGPKTEKLTVGFDVPKKPAAVEEPPAPSKEKDSDASAATRKSAPRTSKRASKDKAVEKKLK